MYYIILYSALFILSKLGLVIFGLKIEHPWQVIGLGMITFAFFILVNWESEYINLITVGTSTGVSQAYWGSEDGATWFFWYHVLGIKDIEISRLLTYVLTPFLFSLGGGFLLEHKATFTGDTFNWSFFNRKRRGNL